MDPAVTPLPDPHFWSGRRVLVTGNTGFKGSWLTYWLQELNAEVLGLALPALPTKPCLWEALSFAGNQIQADIRSASWVNSARDFAPEVVFHLAAQPLVSVGYLRPGTTFETNTMGVVRVLEALTGLPSLAAVVVITTDKVYSPRQTGPHAEDAFLGGDDPYSASKAAAELVCSAWPAGQLPLVTARAGNVVGGGDWAQGRLIPDLVRAWSQGVPLQLRDPNGVRPWQHVLEPLRGYLLYAQAVVTTEVMPSALNFGPETSDMVPVSDLVDFSAELWADEAGGSPDPVWTADPKPHYSETSKLTLDSSRALSELGWSSTLSWRDTMTMTLTWYREYLSGVSAKALVQRDLDLYYQRAYSVQG